MRNCYFRESKASMKLKILDKFGGENKTELRLCLNDLLDIQKSELKKQFNKIIKEL